MNTINKPNKIKEIFPSIENKEYWIYAVNSHFQEKSEKLLIGKWLIFIPESEVDECWKIIKQNTENNSLGISAKVSTAKPSPLGNSKERVICVYNNCEDNQEIFRTREKLRELGFVKPLCYKQDIATYNKNYGCKSHLYCRK